MQRLSGSRQGDCSGRAAQGAAAVRCHIAHSITVMGLPERNSHRGVRWTLPTVVFTAMRNILVLEKKKKSFSSWMVCLKRTWSLNVAPLNCDQSTYLPCDLGEQGKTLPTAAAVVFQHPVCARAAKCSRLCPCPGGSQHRWEVKKYKYYCTVLTYCTEVDLSTFQVSILYCNFILE